MKYVLASNVAIKCPLRGRVDPPIMGGRRHRGMRRRGDGPPLQRTDSRDRLEPRQVGVLGLAGADIQAELGAPGEEPGQAGAADVYW